MVCCLNSVSWLYSIFSPNLYSPKTKLKVAAVGPWLYYCKRWVWKEGTDLAYGPHMKVDQ